MYNPAQHCSVGKNKRNFSTITSRVSASPRRRHCRCRIPGQQERKVRRRIRHFSGDHHRTAAVVTTASVDYCCCRSNSHADITDETVTTRLVDHRSVLPVQRVALRRFQNHGTERLSHEIRRRTNRQHHCYTNESTFIRLSHEKKTCAQTDNFNSTD